MPPILSVENLSIHRGNAHLVQGIDWTVRRGEHWVILGANGSGKTSLLRALGGYLTPSEGAVHLLGETFGEADWRELRTRLGFVSARHRATCFTTRTPPSRSSPAAARP